MVDQNFSRIVRIGGTTERGGRDRGPTATLNRILFLRIYDWLTSPENYIVSSLQKKVWVLWRSVLKLVSPCTYPTSGLCTQYTSSTDLQSPCRDPSGLNSPKVGHVRGMSASMQSMEDSNPKIRGSFSLENCRLSLGWKKQEPSFHL